MRLRHAAIVFCLCLVTPLSAFSDTQATPRLIIQAGDSFPGGIVERVTYAQADATGTRIVFQVWGWIDALERQDLALLLWDSGAIQTLAVMGDPLGANDTHTQWYNIEMNASGQFVFGNSGRIYLHDGDGFVEVISASTAPPGKNWSWAQLHHFNDNGDIIFSSSESGGTTLQIRSSSGGVEDVMRIGDTTIEGDVIDRFQGVRLNNAGDVMFSVGLDSVYWIRLDRQIQRLVHLGDPLPGGGTMDGGAVYPWLGDGPAFTFVVNHGNLTAQHPGQILFIEGGAAQALTVEKGDTPWPPLKWTAYTSNPTPNRTGEMVIVGSFI